jgi:hypothetical protein
MKKQVNVTMKYSEYKDKFSQNKTVKDSYNATNKTIKVIMFELENEIELTEKVKNYCLKNEKITNRLLKVKNGERSLEGAFEETTRSIISNRFDDILSFQECNDIAETTGYNLFIDAVIKKILENI